MLAVIDGLVEMMISQVIKNKKDVIHVSMYCQFSAGAAVAVLFVFYCFACSWLLNQFTSSSLALLVIVYSVASHILPIYQFGNDKTPWSNLGCPLDHLQPHLR